MCGIIGYVGEKKAVPILLEGLKRLEYRGYDSSGIGIIAKKDDKIVVRNMILSHATGLGESFARDVVRATLLLRLNAFAADVSGISSVLAQRFVDFLNADLTPVMPCKGSVGASGDLAPLAHLSAALCGFAEAEIDYQGRRLAAAQRRFVATARPARYASGNCGS